MCVYIYHYTRAYTLGESVACNQVPNYHKPWYYLYGDEDISKVVAKIQSPKTMPISWYISSTHSKILYSGLVHAYMFRILCTSKKIK